MKLEYNIIKRVLVAVILFLSVGGTMCSAQDTRTNYFVPSTSDYCNSMLITCIVKQGDKQLTDCEVAAFDKNGQCRGTMLSNISQDGRIYLMVFGDASEILTFKVASKGGQIYNLAETLSYSTDAEIGDLLEPFVFHVAMRDINKDGKQSIADMVVLIHMLNGGDRTPYDVQAADIDGSGTLTKRDLELLEEIILCK